MVFLQSSCPLSKCSDKQTFSWNAFWFDPNMWMSDECLWCHSSISNDCTCTIPMSPYMLCLILQIFGFCFVLHICFCFVMCEKAKSCDLLLIQTEKLQPNRDTVFFRDGVRRIDFVLSYVDDKDERKQVSLSQKWQVFHFHFWPLSILQRHKWLTVMQLTWLHNLFPGGERGDFMITHDIWDVKQLLKSAELKFYVVTAWRKVY